MNNEYLLVLRMKKSNLLLCKGFLLCFNYPFKTSKITALSRFFTTVKMGEPKWKTEKNQLMVFDLEEKRKKYFHKTYITDNQIVRWDKYYQERHDDIILKKPNLDDVAEFNKISLDNSKTKTLIKKIALFTGDITHLEIDAIVNAANSRLKAGGGVDGAIHRAAGKYLQDECDSLGGCATGSAKVTSGYNLPAKWVIHTVGPQDGNENLLRLCYEKCLSFQKQYNIKFIAFPCISTGIYGFPNRLAAHIALQTVRKFLETNEDLELVIMCTFMPIDVDIYETLMQMYFPIDETRRYATGASLTE